MMMIIKILIFVDTARALYITIQYQVLFITTLKDGFYYFSYFTDEETEAEKLNNFPQVVDLGPKCRQNWQSLVILVCVCSFLGPPNQRESSSFCPSF